MKIDEHNLIIEKAKTRKDGVYSLHGYLYLVKNNQFIAYSDYCGIIYNVHGVFHTRVKKCERHDSKKELLKYLI